MKNLFVFISFFLLSCQSNNPIIKQEYDDFKQRTFISLSDNLMFDGDNLISVRFDFYASIGSIDTSYFLKIYYFADNWLYIKEESPATLIVDGKIINVNKSKNKITDIFYPSRIEELLTIRIEKEFIRTLANAKTVKIRLNGERIYDTYFRPHNFTAMRGFCDRLKI